jgi:hypothetical protein
MEGEIKQSQAGNWQIQWKYLVIDGEHKGKFHYSWDGLQGDRSFEFVAAKLKLFGVDPAAVSLTQLPDILKELGQLRPVIKIQTKQNGDFLNTYWNKYLSDWEDESGGGQAPAADPDPAGEYAGDPPLDERPEPQIGMTVIFKNPKGEDTEGTITELHTDEEEISVKAGNKTHRLSISAVEIGMNGDLDK